jgi:hypothetical protein
LSRLEGRFLRTVPKIAGTAATVPSFSGAALFRAYRIENVEFPAETPEIPGEKRRADAIRCLEPVHSPKSPMAYIHELSADESARGTGPGSDMDSEVS